MVLDSGTPSYEQNPHVLGASPRCKGSGKKFSERNGLRLYSYLSPAPAPDSDSTGLGQTPKTLTKPKCPKASEARPEVKRLSGTCPTFSSPCSWMRRSESTRAVNSSGRARAQIRSAASLPHIAKPKAEEIGNVRKSPCLLVALRPLNIDTEREKFFQSCYTYNPQFEYEEPLPVAVLEKYKDASDQFITQVVVQLTDDLLSQAVMMVENSRPTLAINLSGARQYWLEGMLRHEIVFQGLQPKKFISEASLEAELGTHYIRGVNNAHQPWHSSEGRKQYGLKPANPTEEGLASLHSVLFRKQPFLWRAALLYYTIYQASHMSFCALFCDLEQYVQDARVRWEYCVRAKRGQTDTSQPGCFSKDQVYLDGILRILRHRQTIDFQLLAALGKVSYEDVNHLKKFGVLEKARIPHFMQDLGRYMKQLDHIIKTNRLNEKELEQLLPD
ncbi:microtubule-associated tyrosine carboxypeptidase 1 isoform X3 [Alligator mississippiensis]|uniref:microtubule-associated tyrosine carboxypeptidase 1 isoform X3 n=1 Tax=Alligator mississippiensis TaxID=8496 RepID=UPI0028772A98|nr:microtubule-associated tyrosine carboxypeptidase 1 isoform X3 [Alligator mississippiensis]